MSAALRAIENAGHALERQEFEKGEFKAHLDPLKKAHNLIFDLLESCKERDQAIFDRVAAKKVEDFHKAQRRLLVATIKYKDALAAVQAEEMP